MAAATIIAGYDPGLASGGLVAIALEDDAVLASYSLVEPKGFRSQCLQRAQKVMEDLDGWGDKEFISATIRAEAAMQRFRQAFEDIQSKVGDPVAIATESFVDQPSRAKQLQQKRWQTPLLIGRVIPWLADQGYSPEAGNLIYQNAGVVLPQLRVELARLKNRRARGEDCIVKGDHLVTNDHQRTALAHALALAPRLRSRAAAL